jgi:hypothetical protein
MWVTPSGYYYEGARRSPSDKPANNIEPSYVQRAGILKTQVIQVGSPNGLFLGQPGDTELGINTDAGENPLRIVLSTGETVEYAQDYYKAWPSFPASSTSYLWIGKYKFGMSSRPQDIRHTLPSSSTEELGGAFDTNKSTSTATYSESNTRVQSGSSGNWRPTFWDTPLSGKQYIEFELIGFTNILVGITNHDNPNNWMPASDEAYMVGQAGHLRNDSSLLIIDLIPDPSPGDIIGFAIDSPNGRAWVSHNGSWAQGNPETNTNPPITFSGEKYLGASIYDTDTDLKVIAAGPFNYTVPLGFNETPEGTFSLLKANMKQYEFDGDEWRLVDPRVFVGEVTTNSNSEITSWVEYSFNGYAREEINAVANTPYTWNHYIGDIPIIQFPIGDVSISELDEKKVTFTSDTSSLMTVQAMRAW